jgi:hypothetical protein
MSKIEIPNLSYANSKLTFFSLYMHTAKKEDSFTKVIGEKRFLKKGYEKSSI